MPLSSKLQASCYNILFFLVWCSSGFYHDPNAGWYYSSRDGLYYTFENGIYVLLESVKVANWIYTFNFIFSGTWYVRLIFLFYVELFSYSLQNLMLANPQEWFQIDLFKMKKAQNLKLIYLREPFPIKMDINVRRNHSKKIIFFRL